MSIHAKDSTVTFKWAIAPSATPPVKADFDIILTLPNQNATYTNDGITTYVAPTATVQGEATFDLTLSVLGRYIVTLADGTDSAHIIEAHREIYSVDPPDYVLNGPTLANGGICSTQGPGVIPPIDQTLFVVTQGTEISAGNEYWGFTTRTSPFGPFGSIDRNSFEGETITSVFFFDSGTSGDGFQFSVSGDQTSSGASYLFTSITPEDTGVVLTPANRSNFVYDSGSDETQWLWHKSSLPALIIPAVWNGSGDVDVVIVPV